MNLGKGKAKLELSIDDLMLITEIIEAEYLFYRSAKPLLSTDRTRRLYEILLKIEEYVNKLEAEGRE